MSILKRGIPALLYGVLGVFHNSLAIKFLVKNELKEKGTFAHRDRVCVSLGSVIRMYAIFQTSNFAIMKLIKLVLACLLVSGFATMGFAQKGTMPSVKLKTLKGKEVNIQDYTNNGKITVISFWATWCSPCKKELNTIADMYEEWQDEYDVQLIAVSIDNARAVRKVKPMVDSFGWDYIVLSDVNEDLKRAMGIQTVPHTLLIDQNGKIVDSHSGYKPGDEVKLEEKIKELAR